MIPDIIVANFNAGKMNGKTVPINMAGIIAAGTPNCMRTSPGRIFLSRPLSCVSSLHVFAKFRKYQQNDNHISHLPKFHSIENRKQKEKNYQKSFDLPRFNVKLIAFTSPGTTLTTMPGIKCNFISRS